jgi:hypothetical protein
MTKLTLQIPLQTTQHKMTQIRTNKTIKHKIIQIWIKQITKRKMIPTRLTKMRQTMKLKQPIKTLQIIAHWTKQIM